ncbi:DUF2614 family zinc ribbon-containing protein, partial [Paenibacillus sp.]
CPECARQTKILGKTDRCMFCRTILTLDPNKATAESGAVESNAEQDKKNDITIS